jgi:hypothetical protein
MEQSDLEQMISKLSDMIGERLRVRGKTFQGRVKKAGRLLPRSVRRAAGELIEARTMAENPVLAKVVDPDAVHRAYKTCTRFLDEVDPVAARSRKRYNLASIVSLQVIIVAVLAIAVMQWRDLI